MSSRNKFEPSILVFAKTSTVFPLTSNDLSKILPFSNTSPPHGPPALCTKVPFSLSLFLSSSIYSFPINYNTFLF